MGALLTVFGVFIPALLLPGPDFVGVVRSALTRGTAAGLRTALGVSVGLVMFATLSLLGLSAVLAEYQWLTWFIRVLGGAYLIYLGVMLVRAPPRAAEEGAETAVKGGAFVFGLSVTLTNPKAVVLFASVFATAVTPETPGWWMALAIALVFASALSWYSLVACFMASDVVARRFRNARRTIERVAGVCFVAIGCRLIADARTT
jgi:threonine/homoserine/homoserine lactone efflux protein